MKMEIVGQREPGLSAVRLWEKSLPFLLSFLGIYFMFLDFVFFAQLGSLFIVNKDKQEVIPQKKPLLCFQSLDIRELNSEMVSLRSKYQVTSMFKLKGNRLPLLWKLV